MDSPQLKTFRASHTVVTIETYESEFTRLGFSTWKCAECDVLRVPGLHPVCAPEKVGE